jgi:hypothetical protein
MRGAERLQFDRVNIATVHLVSLLRITQSTQIAAVVRMRTHIVTYALAPQPNILTPACLKLGWTALHSGGTG